MTAHSFHELASTFRLLEGEALAALGEDIRTHGLIEPIWLYQGKILDGRNRYNACQAVGVQPRFVIYDGDDPVGFSWSQNGARRHLTPGELAMAALDVEQKYAAEARKRQAEAGKEYGRGQRKLEADLPQAFDAPPKKPTKKRAPQSRERAAAVTGVSSRAIAQAKRVTEQAPDLVEKVRTGETTLNRAERIIRDRDAETKRIAQAKREAASAGVSAAVDLRTGDFREVLADLHDVDAIITDPPYPREFLPLLGDLATWADRVLKPDGVLVVLIGQSYLPDVYRLLEGGRPYRWTACYLTAGAGYVSHHRRLQSGWKPLLVYGGGPRFSDVVRSSGDDKAHHRWGQDYSAFHEIVERFTERGDTVADPFMGGGTTLLAAHALGRHAVGADVDADAVEAARRRFA